MINETDVLKNQIYLLRKKIKAVLKYSNRMEKTIKQIKKVLTESTNTNCYRMELNSNNGILELYTKNKQYFSVQLHGKLFILMNLLLNRLQQDREDNKPIQIQGFISRQELEMELFDKIQPLKSNRLNMCISRLKKVLKEAGFPDVIEAVIGGYRINE